MCLASSDHACTAPVILTTCPNNASAAHGPGSNIKPLKHDLAHLDNWGLLFTVIWLLGELLVGLCCWLRMTVSFMPLPDTGRQNSAKGAATLICC